MASKAPLPVSGIASTAGAIYMISISVRVGSTVVSLDPELFKGADMQQALKEEGVKSKELLPIFEVYTVDAESGKEKKFSLQQAGTALNNALDPLQKSCMICSGSKRWWFYPESKHSTVLNGIESLKEKLAEQLQKLEENWQGAKSNYEGKLRRILSRVGKSEEFPVYALKFPSIEQIKTDFRIEVEGPIRVPSVDEAAKQSPEFKMWVQQIHEQLHRDLPDAIDKSALAVAELLTRLKDANIDDLSNKEAKKLAECHDRTQTMLNLYNSMATGTFHPIKHLTEWVLKLTPGNVTGEKLQTELHSIRQHLLEENWVTEPVTKGAKELAIWAGIQSFEDRIKQFKKEVALFSLEQEELTLEEREERLEQLRKQAQSYSGILKSAAASLLESVSEAMETLETIQPASATEPIASVVEPEPEQEPEPEEEEEKPQPRRELATVGAGSGISDIDDEVLEAGF